MAEDHNQFLQAVRPVLDRSPCPVTLSDLNQPDQPLVFMNRAFMAMTGCSQAHLGQNCRLLQEGCDNTEARQEIRAALSRGGRTQVLLRNRRVTGEAFFNLLWIEVLGPTGTFENLALGTQFELEQQAARPLLRDAALSRKWHVEPRDVIDHALRLRLEQRRAMTSSAIQMVRSFDLIHRIQSDRLTRTS